MNVEPWGTTGPGASTLVVPGIQYLLRAHGHAVVVDGALRSRDHRGGERRPIGRRCAGRRHRGAADVASSRDQHAERLNRRRRTRRAAVRARAVAGHRPARRRRRFRPDHRGARAVLPGVVGAHAGRRRRARDLVVLQHLPTGGPTVAPGEGGRDAEFELARARGAAPAAFPGRDDRGGRGVRSAQRRGGAHVPDDPARHVHLAPPWASSTGRR